MIADFLNSNSHKEIKKKQKNELEKNFEASLELLNDEDKNKI